MYLYKYHDLFSMIVEERVSKFEQKLYEKIIVSLVLLKLTLVGIYTA